MPSRSRNLLSVGALAVLLLPGALGLVRTANRIIVPAGDTISGAPICTSVKFSISTWNSSPPGHVTPRVVSV